MGKILIIADQDDSCYATPRGLELAAKLGQQADVVAFAHTSLKSLDVSAAKSAKIKKLLLRDREKTVQERIKKFKQRGQKVTLKVVWAEDITPWVKKQCANGAYLGVVKTGSASGPLVHTGSNWHLLRECQAPLLLVSQKKWHHTKPVLAALDLVRTSKRKRLLNHKVLSAARDLAQALDVELKVITAVEVPTLLADLDLVEPDAYVREAKEKMRAEIKKLADEYDLPQKAFLCKRGPIEKVITSTAAKVRAQIVVMGTVSRGGVAARVLGNRAEEVLEHLHTDVLAIKP